MWKWMQGMFCTSYAQIRPAPAFVLHTPLMHRSYVEVDARHFLHIISTHQASPRICAAHTLNASLFGGSGCKGTGSGRRVAAFEWRGAAVVELQNTHTHTHTKVGLLESL